VIKKLTDPSTDTTASFGFTATGGISPASFALKNGETATFISVAPGTYTVTESAVPTGWTLTSLVCVDPTGNTTTTLSMAKATIDLASGETVTCTFTNSQSGTLTVAKVTIPNDTSTPTCSREPAAPRGTSLDGGLEVVDFVLRCLS
jgi:hypothetical protein